MAFSVPQVGDTFEERYQLTARLGAGSYALVFKAEQLNIGRVVAVKILLPSDKGFDDSTLMRFQREAKLLAQLRHPNTLIIHDFGWTHAGHPFLVTEYVPGLTLKDEMVAKGKLDPRRAVAIMRQVLGSLKEAHAYGVIHRDIKPANIMLFDRLDETDVVKVLDFGIAKFIDSVSDEDANLVLDLTARDRLMGTPRYMAPEQLAKKTLTPATDIYGLGLLFYEVLTGRYAVEGRTSAVVIARQLDDKPVIRKDDPEVPRALQPFLQRCTAKLQGDRFQSVQEALEFIDTQVKLGGVGMERSSDSEKSSSRGSIVSMAVKAASRLLNKDAAPEAAQEVQLPGPSANPSALPLTSGLPRPALPSPATPTAPVSLPPSLEPLALNTADIVLDDVQWPDMPALPGSSDFDSLPGLDGFEVNSPPPKRPEVTVNLPGPPGASASPSAFEPATIQGDKNDLDVPPEFVTVDLDAEDQLRELAAAALAMEVAAEANAEADGLAELAASDIEVAEDEASIEALGADAVTPRLADPDASMDSAFKAFSSPAAAEDDDDIVVAGKRPVWIYVAGAAAVALVIGLVVAFAGGGDGEPAAIADSSNTAVPARRAEPDASGSPTTPLPGDDLPKEGAPDGLAATDGATNNDDAVEDGDNGDPAAESRKVLVQSEPQGAQVVVNTKVLGQTPLFVTASLSGTTRVDLEHEGFKPHHLDLGPESEDDVTIKLQPEGAAPNARRTPDPNARVVTNAQRRRTDPKTDGKADGKGDGKTEDPGKKSRFTPF